MSKTRSESTLKSVIKETPKNETFRYVDGVEIALTVLEDIDAISESFDSAMELFNTSNDIAL